MRRSTSSDAAKGIPEDTQRAADRAKLLAIITTPGDLIGAVDRAGDDGRGRPSSQRR
jgi:hypothetical protein